MSVTTELPCPPYGIALYPPRIGSKVLVACNPTHNSGTFFQYLPALSRSPWSVPMTFERSLSSGW